MAAAKSNINRLPPLPTIRDLIRLYRLRALKQFSQNFIMDFNVTDKIVRKAGNIAGAEVCEVGPGPGNITRSILKQEPKRVIVIEKDIRFKPMLNLLAEATDIKLDVIYSDVMGFDMSDLFDKSLKKEWNDYPPNIRLIGNLPFSVATHLIIRWLENISTKTSAWSYGRVPMTLTFQKEVAERMAAREYEPRRCRLSVMCQNWCKVKHAFTLPGKVFVPEPDVDVGVVHFEPLIRPLIPIKFEIVEKVLRTFFNMRRQLAYKPCRHLFPLSQREKLSEEMFKMADVYPRMRTFHISNEEWGRLIKAYTVICDREPKLYNYDFRGSKTNRERGFEDNENEEEEEEDLNQNRKESVDSRNQLAK